jgi:acetylornithine deacetylase/succinyl-diaminopimelate desuccinylase-like protein
MLEKTDRQPGAGRVSDAELDNALDAALKKSIVEITCALVDIPSPTGEEQAIAQYVAALYRELGMEVEMQEVEPGRHNVVARLRGRGTGRSLMFNGHFDTSTTGKEEGLPFGHKPQARVVDDWIYGLGVSNMKNAFAGYYGAISMLKRLNVELDGDIVITGVVGEIEKGPIDQYQGAEFRGGGMGTMFASHHGVITDNAILGEPSGLRVQLGNTSYIFARVQTKGVAQHTWSKENGEDAIEKCVKIMEAIRDWEPIFEAKHEHPRMGSRIGIGAIQGGYPFKPAICPAPYCNLYLDFRFPPDVTIAGMRREIQSFLDSLRANDPRLESELKLFMCRPGSEIEASTSVARAVHEAHVGVFGEEPSEPTRYRYCVSSDPSILDHYGIPALTYGAGGIRQDGTYSMYDQYGEILSIENLFAATRVYARSALALTEAEAAE